MKNNLENHLSIRLSLNPFDLKKMFTFNVSQDVMRHHSYFETKSFVEKKIFQSENEMFLISSVKDKVYQLYSNFTKNSPILNKTKEKMKSKEYIDSKCEMISNGEILAAMAQLMEQFSKWLIGFVTELPGFDKFSSQDFDTLIANSTMHLHGLHQNEFFIDDELLAIIGNHPRCFQMSRNRMNVAFGLFKANLIFTVQSKFKKLKLTQNEISILYPFSILKLNRNIVFFLFF